MMPLSISLRIKHYNLFFTKEMLKKWYYNNIISWITISALMHVIAFSFISSKVIIMLFEQDTQRKSFQNQIAYNKSSPKIGSISTILLSSRAPNGNLQLAQTSFFDRDTGARSESVDSKLNSKAKADSATSKESERNTVGKNSLLPELPDNAISEKLREILLAYGHSVNLKITISKTGDIFNIQTTKDQHSNEKVEQIINLLGKIKVEPVKRNGEPIEFETIVQLHGF